MRGVGSTLYRNSKVLAAERRAQVEQKTTRLHPRSKHNLKPLRLEVARLIDMSDPGTRLS